jgi:5'-3' exonuclease
MTDQSHISTVALIDVAGVFRANFAIQPDHTAVTKTVEKVRSLRAQYDHCAVCVDSPPYRRAKLSPSYKGQREAIGAVGRELYARTKQALADDGIAVLGAEGYEADDVLATLTAQLVARSADKQVAVVIVSADKDMAQLVSDARRVTLLNWSTDVLLDEAGVRVVFGVAPSKVRDLLALMGDVSDNIVGVRGVGKKIAALVVNSEPGLEGALAGEAIKNLTASFTDRIAEAREAVILARKLVTLETDAPVSADEIFVKREPKPQPEVMDAEFEDERPEPPPAPQDAPPQPGPRKVEPTAIVKRPDPPKEWALQLEPCTTPEAWTMAVKLHNSRLFSQFTSAEAIFAVVLRGRSLGIDAVTSLANFHVIEGKPTMHASLIVGLVLKSGLAEYFELVESTEEKATWATKRKGGRREVLMSFSVSDALNAGLMVGTPENARGKSSGKPSNWDKYRRTMLRWRAATELARAVYPDITTGIYTPDEISDGMHDPEIEAKHAAA